MTNDNPTDNPLLAKMIRFIETVETNAVKGTEDVFDKLQPEADETVKQVFMQGAKSGASMMRLLLLELVAKDSPQPDDGAE
ncbi:MAG: hypothetical protein GF399_02900 [Candidatus Coatesbacteria bacterium]|nr:hypothetical protein [Candidatus Coatesbacteria bacterium]